MEGVHQPYSQPIMGPPATRRSRLVVVGFILAIASLVLPPLAIASFVIAIIVLVRGRLASGVIMLVLSLVLPVAGVFLLLAFVAKPYRVPSESMAPALLIGDRLLANRLAGDPAAGDVVVFHPPAGATGKVCGVRHSSRSVCPSPTPSEDKRITFVKRVIAGPGDAISIRDGYAVVNGKPQRESYVRACRGNPQCNYPTPVTVPPDHYFMLGDNRGTSDDSRYWGPVPKDWILGSVFFIYSPTDRIGSCC